MKKGILVKGVLASVLSVSSMALADAKKDVQEICSSSSYTFSDKQDSQSGLNKGLRAAYDMDCLDLNRSAKQAELESAFGASKKLALRECVGLLNDSCESTLGYSWEVKDMYPDAKCEVLNDKAGKKDVLVLYSTSHDTITAFPLLASNQKCGQLQMKAPRLTSVAKFGEKVAFVVNGALFELHNVTTPNGKATLVVNEIKNAEKKSYSTIKSVEESAYEDKVMAVRNNNQVITIDKDALTVSSGRLTRVGNANVERAKSLEVSLIAQ